jgi:hypothetical protein
VSSSPVKIPGNIEDKWVDELSADVAVISSVSSTVDDLPGGRGVALAGCILASRTPQYLTRARRMVRRGPQMILR